MVWLGIKKLAKELNFQLAGSEAAGIVGNLFITLADRSGMKTMRIVFPELKEEDKNELIAIFKDQKIKRYTFDGNKVDIIFLEKLKPYSVKKIKEHIRIIQEYYSKRYFNAKHKCHQCNEIEDASVYYGNEGAIYLCKSCFSNLEHNIEKENREKSYEPNNYIQGFLGALLFAIPGILVTILCFNVLERLAAISAVAYIYLAQKGYLKFGGKHNLTGAIIINLTGIIMIVIGVITAYTILIYQAVGSPDLNLIREVYENPEVQKDLVINIVKAIGISLIYIVVNIKQMAGTWSADKIKKGEKID